MSSSSQAFQLNTPTHGTITLPSSSSSSSSAATASSSFPTSIKITPSPTQGHPTDIWRKPGPPEISTFNAPILYRKVELKRFQSVRVKVGARWRGLYDQGGLVFILPPSNLNTTNKTDEEIGQSSKWVKTGIEFYNSTPLVSTVSRDTWADWSLYPDGIVKNEETGEASVTLLIERLEKDDTFWVYVVCEDEKGNGEVKKPIREITWVLSEDVKEVWVGVYAATPKGMEDGDREKLNVSFEDLRWEFRD